MEGDEEPVFQITSNSSSSEEDEQEIEEPEQQVKQDPPKSPKDEHKLKELIEKEKELESKKETGKDVDKKPNETEKSKKEVEKKEGEDVPKERKSSIQMAKDFFHIGSSGKKEKDKLTPSTSSENLPSVREKIPSHERSLHLEDLSKYIKEEVPEIGIKTTEGVTHSSHSEREHSDPHEHFQEFYSETEGEVAVNKETSDDVSVGEHSVGQNEDAQKGDEAGKSNEIFGLTNEQAKRYVIKKRRLVRSNTFL